MALDPRIALMGRGVEVPDVVVRRGQRAQAMRLEQEAAEAARQMVAERAAADIIAREGVVTDGTVGRMAGAGANKVALDWYNRLGERRLREAQGGAAEALAKQRAALMRGTEQKTGFEAELHPGIVAKGRASASIEQQKAGEIPAAGDVLSTINLRSNQGARAAGMEQRDAEQFQTDQPVRAAVASATLADANVLSPAQRQQADLAKANAEATNKYRAATLANQRQRTALLAQKQAQSGGGGGKNLNESAINKLESGKSFSDQLGGLAQAFKDEYSGNTVTGGLENAVGKIGGEDFGLTDKGQTDYWQTYQDYVNLVRNKLFGSALSATEAKEFDKAVVGPRTNPKIVRTNLARQKEIIDTALNRRADTYKAGGFNAEQVAIYRPSVGASMEQKFQDAKTQLKVGTIQPGDDGEYVFMGGDRYDKKNWKKK